MPETFAQYLEKWLKQSTAHGLNNLLLACLLLTSTCLTGCAIPITYHDAITYRNLTDLKADRERKPSSVYELAKMLNRDLKNVNQDLKMLSELKIFR